MSWWMKLLCTLVVITVAAGCSKIAVSTKLTTGTDLRTLGSYAFAGGDRLETGEVVVDETGLDPSIQAAIRNELDAKGYARVAFDEADFQVRYHATVEHRVDEMDINADQTDRAGWWGPRDDEGYVVDPGVTGQYVREWDEGTLVIDFVDPATTRVLYRMKADTQVQLYTIDEEERLARVTKVVRKMLADVPAR